MVPDAFINPLGRVVVVESLLVTALLDETAVASSFGISAFSGAGVLALKNQYKSPMSMQATTTNIIIAYLESLGFCVWLLPTWYVA